MGGLGAVLHVGGQRGRNTADYRTGGIRSLQGPFYAVRKVDGFTVVAFRRTIPLFKRAKYSFRPC